MAAFMTMYADFKAIPLNKKIICAAVILTFLLLISAMLHFANITPERIVAATEIFKQSFWAPFITVGIFIIGGLCFVPLTVMTIATAIAFGPVQGIVISLTGATISATISYHIGYFLGRQRLKKWIGPFCDDLQHKVESAGIIGITALRFVFLVPYTIGNMCFGVVGVSFRIFILGTFLALIPGAVIRSILGNSFVGFFQHPDLKNTAYFTACVFVWISIVIAVNKFVKK